MEVAVQYKDEAHLEGHLVGRYNSSATWECICKAKMVVANLRSLGKYSN